ncbi:hypothetical protein IJD34_07720 [bacterium]|nr:hypothetical protein [bacterium]
MNKLEPKMFISMSIVAIILIVFVSIIGHASKAYNSEDKNITNKPAVRSVQRNVEQEKFEKEQRFKRDEDSIFGTKTASVENSAEDDFVDDEDIPEPVKLPKKLSKTELPELEPITMNGLPEQAINANSESSNSVNSSDLYITTFANARKMINDKDFLQALETLKKASSLAQTDERKADCLEQTALVYAKMKKYGTALSNAQRANNLVPSVSRELLIAKIYYKTGYREKSQEKLNAIMQRDFVYDR